MKVTAKKLEGGELEVRIHGYPIDTALIISADDEAGEVWCRQLDENGKPSKAEKASDEGAELKTGTVTIVNLAEEAAQKKAEEAARLAAEAEAARLAEEAERTPS